MSQAATTEAESQTSRNQFGTFGGVFTPSILTILGVIMFMRAGYVTGQAGILSTVLILLISKAITFLTGLSISAVSTNTEVKGGGAYFLISRSLGPEFGGAIGLTLYLAQAFSVPFYVLGFVEALVLTFPQYKPHFMNIGLASAALLFLITYVGAHLAIKAQYLILTVLLLSIIAFMGGAIADFDLTTLEHNWQPGYTSPEISFWTVFAIFFPAVTGILAGVNMSGDLKDPARSIPSGTLAAIAVGGLVYLAQIVLVGGSTPRLEMVATPYESLLDKAFFGLDFLVVGGVFAATISSAIGSFMGAPRILQALARDGIFPMLRPFAIGSAQGDEPRRGLWLTFGLTLAVIFAAGNDAGGEALNSVATLLSMFFLYTYGMTNLAAFTESFSGNPSFRPRFRFFHWSTALLGALGCVGVTLLIDALWSVAALAILLVIFTYVSRRVLTTTFGDARRGFYYARARDNLLRLGRQPSHPKNWRPTTLVLTGDPNTRLTLASYAVWFASRRGLVTLAEILVGDLHQLLAERRQRQQVLGDYIEQNKLDAFAEVLAAPNLYDGMASLFQAYSIGPIKTNLVVLGWSQKDERAVPFARNLRLIAELGMSQVLVVDHGLPKEGAAPRVDIWWRGQRNGSLMLILAYLLTLNWEWGNAHLRILRLLGPDDDKEATRREILDLANAARIEVGMHLVEPADSFREVLLEHSADASLVLLGFQPPATDENALAFHQNYSRLTEGLPTTLLTCSSGDADLLA